MNPPFSNPPITATTHLSPNKKIFSFISPRLYKSNSHPQSQPQSLYEQIIDPLSIKILSINNKNHLIRRNSTICAFPLFQSNEEIKKIRNSISIHRHFQVQDSDKQNSTQEQKQRSNHKKQYDRNTTNNTLPLQQITNYTIIQTQQSSKVLQINFISQNNHHETSLHKQSSCQSNHQHQIVNNNISNITKLRIFLKTFSQFKQKFQKKLISHLSKLSTSDKYIRQIMSFIKIYKSFYPQQIKFNNLSKQLSILRRVIQWESKYQIIKQFKIKQLGIFQVGFKTFEFVQNIMDFMNFWGTLLMLHNKKLFKSSYSYNICVQFIQLLQTHSNDCYFYQCIISSLVYLYNLLLSLYEYKQIIISNNQQYRNNQTLYQIKKTYNQINQRFDRIRHMQQDNTKNNNNKNSNQIQIHKEFIQLQNLLTKEQTEQTIYDQQYYNQQKIIKSSIKSDIIKNLIKFIKFAIDSITSYNNYSRKAVQMNSKYLGWLAVVSSGISMGLIWAY